MSNLKAELNGRWKSDRRAAKEHRRRKVKVSGKGVQASARMIGLRAQKAARR